MAVFEQMYRSHIRTGSDWYINNHISIVHPGAKKMTAVKFRHQLDIPNLIVSKKSLTEAALSHAKSKPIEILQAREQFLLRDSTFTTATPWTGDFAGKLTHKTLSEALTIRISQAISPSPHKILLAPLVWALNLQSLDVIADRSAFWNVLNDYEELGEQAIVEPPWAMRVLTEVEHKDIVEKKEFPNGTKNFKDPTRMFAVGDWFLRDAPLFPTHHWPGHFRLHVTLAMYVLEKGKEQPYKLRCVFNAEDMELISVASSHAFAPSENVRWNI